MLQKKIITRIPGNIPGPSPKEKQGYIDDLSSKTKPELLELIERQDKILANKSFINKLPDKGARISQFRTRLADELVQRDEIENTRGLLSNLRIGKSSVSDEIEWTGKCSKDHNKNQTLDSDDESDEERNPLKILASQAGTYKKLHRVEKPEQSFIKPEDLQDVNYSDLNGILGKKDGDVYVKRLCEKVTKPKENKKEPFLPHRTTKKGQIGNEGYKKPLGPHWEVTAATPPPLVHGDAKLISLQESLDLQKEQAAKLKEIQTKHAAEKLASQLGIKMGSVLPDSLLQSAYREPNHLSDSSSSEDEAEVIEGEYEEEEREKEDAVIYNLVD